MKLIPAEDIKESEHKKVVNYLKNNNGENLQKLEPKLTLYEKIDVVDYTSNDIDFNESDDYKHIKSILSEPFELVQNIEVDNSDITGFNENDSSIVIVEIKSSEKADYNTFGQILYYMSKAEKYVDGKEVKTVRGVVLAKEIDVSLVMLVKKYENVIPKISLKKYYWSEREADCEDKLLVETVYLMPSEAKM